MKRYKTVLAALCSGPAKHQNLVDDRVHAESPEKAQNATLLNIQRMKCKWCDTFLTNMVMMFGTEELPLYPEYVCLGYTCHCGERVAISRVEKGRQFDIPMDKVTVQCSKGHSRTVHNNEILTLQHWEETTQ
jgi:hypothetical protein